MERIKKRIKTIVEQPKAGQIPHKIYALKTVEKVAVSPAIKVTSLNELMIHLSYIFHYNRGFMLFYRGQGEDFMQKTQAQTNKSSVILPSIYRFNYNKKGLLYKHLIEERKKILNIADELLMEKLNARSTELKKKGDRLHGYSKIRDFDFVRWALLQHYGICKTPLLDLTTSFQVALKFAELDNTKETGVLYIMGFPYITDPISQYSIDRILNINLRSVCPPSALRPYFQEGFLAGHYPNKIFTDMKYDNIVRKMSFHNRLIAKFEIPKSVLQTPQMLTKNQIYVDKQLDPLCKIAEDIKETLRNSKNLGNYWEDI